METHTENQLSPKTSLQNRQSSTTEQRDAWLLSKITLGELLKPGTPILNMEALDLLLELYSELLDEIGADAFDAAFRQVLKTSPFRPDIMEIRRAAGVNRGNTDPVELEADAQLQVLIEGMRGPHGMELKPILGKVMYGTEKDPRDKDGMRDPTPDRHPSTPFPFEKRTEAALVKLGRGKLAAGIDVIADHPTLSRKRDADREEYQFNRIQQADRIEKKFLAAYREA